MDTIYRTLVQDERFGHIAAALKAARLDALLDSPGQFTLCAPADTAFDALPPATASSFAADPEGLLRSVLLFHIIHGTLAAGDLPKLNFPKTRLGITVETARDGSGIHVGTAMITVPDIRCTNGIIHGIDRVILPP